MPAAAVRSAGRPVARCRVRTTPCPGDQTNHLWMARHPLGWTVTTALPSTAKRPMAERSREATGRPASALRVSSYGGIAREGPAGRTAVQPSRGTTWTGTRPRLAQVATGSGSPLRRSIPRPCRAECHGALTGLEGSLRARDALDARVLCNGRAQSPSHGLELRLDDVVGVAPGEHPHMQRDACVLGEALKHVAGELPHIRVADNHVGLSLRLSGVDEIGTAGHVNDRLDERLIEGHRGITEAGDAALVTKGFLERVAEHDGNVLHGVVGVAVDVAGGMDAKR